MRGPLYILTAIFLWSSLGVLVRLSGAAVHELIFYSNAVSLIILALIIASSASSASSASRGMSKYSGIGAKGILSICMLGPLALMNTFSFFFAYKNTTVAKAIITHYIAPVVVAILAPFFLKERLTLRIAAAVAIASMGLWILLGVNPAALVLSIRKADAETIGILSGLFSGLTYAALIIIFRIYSRKYNDPVLLGFLSNLTICLILFPFIDGFPVKAIRSFLIMGVLHSTLAPLLYFKGLETVQANRVAVMGYLEPVCAILFGMIFLNEYPKAVSLIGGALVIFSGYLTLKPEKA